MTGVVYHYQLKTNGWRTVAGAMISLVLFSVVSYATFQNPNDWGLEVFASVSFLIAIWFVLYAIIGFRSPDVSELTIDKIQIRWHTPWPFRCTKVIPFAEIKAVTAWPRTHDFFRSEEEDRLAIRTRDGQLHKVPAITFNMNVEPVIQAIKQAAPDVPILRRDGWSYWRDAA